MCEDNNSKFKKRDFTWIDSPQESDECFFYNFLNNTHFRWKNIYTTLIQRKLLFHLLPLYHFRILSFYFTNLNYTKYSIFEIKDHLVYTSQTCSWIVPEYSMLREIYIKKLKYFSWNGPTTMKMCSLLN